MWVRDDETSQCLLLLKEKKGNDVYICERQSGWRGVDWCVCVDTIDKD